MLKIVALAGGVGGAKLALGLYRLLTGDSEPGEPKKQGQLESLAIIGNTGDDLELFGLRICPDLDTVLYTLAGLANPETGWGIEGDTFATLEMLKRYGEDTWFWLGDRDFGTHILRTRLLGEGQSLTRVTARLARNLGVYCALLPMSNEDIRTMVLTEEAGELPFQHYFVRRQAKDTVRGLNFKGAETARITPEVTEALGKADLIILCPSNPYLSIWPILAVPGMKKALQERGLPIVVVSPIVGGMALKGPAAEIMRTMGGEEAASALGVARIYAGWAKNFVLDKVDRDQAGPIEALGYRVLVTNTIMKNTGDKIRLAREIIQFFSS